jgi:hypothetical protein
VSTDTIEIDTLQSVGIADLAEALAREKPDRVAYFFDRLAAEIQKRAERSKRRDIYGDTPFTYDERLLEIVRALSPDTRDELMAATAEAIRLDTIPMCDLCGDAEATEFFNESHFGGRQFCRTCLRSAEQSDFNNREQRAREAAMAHAEDATDERSEREA